MSIDEAKNRIERCLKSGSRELDLRGNGLKTLPESLSLLIYLESLDLSSNQLTSLPDWLRQLNHLKKLELSNNQLTSLPDWLGQLFTHVRKLDLSNNRLTSLPDWLGQLTQLEELDLKGNDLTQLPEFLLQLRQLRSLGLDANKLERLPDQFGNLKQLRDLKLQENKLKTLPDSFANLSNLNRLYLSENKFKSLPNCITKLEMLQELYLVGNEIDFIPDGIGNLKKLRYFWLGGASLGRGLQLQYGKQYGNKVTALSFAFAQLKDLRELNLDYNPLNPELAQAYKQGLDAVKTYLRAKVEAEITLNEAKLILVGEGAVGKTCLLNALLGKEWQEHPSTHGIDIQQVKVADPDTQKEITLNGWDFGGQRVYRPTHQLFFSAPAVYLVVWKPREGPQQGFVKEWIKLIKHREPSAKIIVVATHGGPGHRQPDIDRQELWDLFGEDTVVEFFFVDSKPDKQGNLKGIAELKEAIARVAVTLPEVGRSVPKSFADARAALNAQGAPYLPFDKVLAICRTHKMNDEIARLFISISHRLSHLTHYENDPALRDIVILRPDWLTTAMSYILDDEITRKNHGIVGFDRLQHLWDDPQRDAENRYASELLPLFLRLMERFDLSYKVSLPTEAQDAISFWQQFKGILNMAAKGKDGLSNFKYTSLIGQLVPDNRPENDLTREWVNYSNEGNLQQVQICRIVDVQNGQSANAEGLFYQLIVRLHKYSLGRTNYAASVHWQRGLVLDDDYNGRALLEHKGNDVHITVRAPYPQRFLTMLTEEVKYLVGSF